VWVENGRIKDTPAQQTKTGLRVIAEEIGPEIRLTPHQNVILTHIAEADRPRVQELLNQHHMAIGEESISTLRRYAMACPALPTCGLAVAESERYLPDVIHELEQRGYGSERVWIRMSGCPNSCSRPPTAEIGIIGRSLQLYNVYVGGSFEGTRLARLYQADVRADALPDMLASLLEQWRHERSPGEAFGDWAHRALVASEA
jgi:sulfite reductase beta subunit-like hemoprotein